MRTQAKSKARFSKGQFYRAVDMTASNQGGVALDSRAFTLVELIVCIGIIGVLATMAIPAYSQLKGSAKVARAESEVRVIDKAVNAYFIDKNKFPDTGHLSDIGPEGSLIDPWGKPYQYSSTGIYKDFTGTPTNDDYDIFSQGPNGTSDSDLSIANSTALDDIIRGGGGSTVCVGKDL